MNPIVHRLLNDVPMVAPSALAAWLDPSPEREAAAQAFGKTVAERLLGEPTERAAESEFKKYLRDTMKVSETITDDGIAVIPVDGALAYAPDAWEMLFDGVEDIRSVSACLSRLKKDPKVPGAVLNINSPGGMMMGGFDLAEEVASFGKPIVAYSGGQMASLAYLIASQADEIVAASSASVGSIGTYLTIFDYTRLLEERGIKVEVFKNKDAKFKAMGLPGTSLSDAQREHLQSRSEAGFAAFRDMVKAKRNVSAEAMQGQTFWGKDAKAMGLIDRVGSLDMALSVVRAKLRTRKQ